MARALSRAGWRVGPVLGRGAPAGALSAAAADVDLVVVATPDSAIAGVASAIAPAETAVVAHMAGSLGLGVLDGHPRAASVHPLAALPDASVGSRRLLSGCWFAVAGDPLALEVVADLGGRAFEVDDDCRAAYHAAAVVASNHLVALLGQAQRIADEAGVPFAAIVDLVRSTVESVAELGPAAALTGPAARGDADTIRRHLEAIAPDEQEAYEALARQARRLADRRAPAGRPR